MDPQVLSDLAKVAYGKGIEILNDMTGWSKLRETNGVVGFARESEGTDFRTFKADYYVDRPPSFVSRYIYDNYPQLNEELQPEDVAFFRETSKINENMHTYEIGISAKGPVSGRELQTVGLYLALSEDTFAEVGCSYESNKPVREGWVRADLVHVVTLYEPVIDDPQRTHVQVALLVDPKGSVPAAISNAIMGNRTNFYDRIKERIHSLN